MNAVSSASARITVDPRTEAMQDWDERFVEWQSAERAAKVRAWEEWKRSQFAARPIPGPGRDGCY